MTPYGASMNDPLMSVSTQPITLTPIGKPMIELLLIPKCGQGELRRFQGKGPKTTTIAAAATAAKMPLQPRDNLALH